MLPCLNCYKKFYNRACHEHHIDINVVTNFRYALCFKQVEVSSTPHECYHAKCPSWKEIVDLTKHQCYIQPIGEEDLPKKKKKNIYKIYNIYKKHLEFYKKNLQKVPPNHVVSTYEEHTYCNSSMQILKWQWAIWVIITLSWYARKLLKTVIHSLIFMERIVQNDFNTVIIVMKKNAHWYVVLPRNHEGVGHGLSAHTYTWGVAFSRITNGVFEGYVNTWLKLKQESSWLTVSEVGRYRWKEMRVCEIV